LSICGCFASTVQRRVVESDSNERCVPPRCRVGLLEARDEVVEAENVDWMSLRVKEGRREGDARRFSVSGRLGPLGVPFPALVGRRGNEELYVKSSSGAFSFGKRRERKEEHPDAPCKS
jgi:hypothetical protein